MIIGFFCALITAFILSNVKDYFIYRQMSEFLIGYIFGGATIIAYYLGMEVTEAIYDSAKT